MFKRRQKRSLIERARELVWPRAGWVRATTYMVHRVSRLQGSTYSIAAGFACGVAVSFTPFIGFHFLLAGLVSWVIGGNVLASAIGTAAGNPWTFPFIWYWIYFLGSRLLGVDGSFTLPETLSFAHIFDHPLDILLPMSVGGLPTAVAVWFPVYWLVRRVISAYRQARLNRILRRAASRAADRSRETGP